jgi:hypothetical protein
MPVIRYSGEGGSHRNLESIVVQVDSVLPADGWRPARHGQNSRKDRIKPQKGTKDTKNFVQLICGFVLFCG